LQETGLEAILSSKFCKIKVSLYIK
jgi:hypothetical protein